MPSRLLTAFPPEVTVTRLPFDAALARVRAKLFGEGGGEPVAQADQSLDVDAAFLRDGGG